MVFASLPTCPDCRPHTLPLLVLAAVCRVDGLRLSAAGLAEARLQHLLVAHMLLEAYTDAAEQCTVALPKRWGTMRAGVEGCMCNCQGFWWGGWTCMLLVGHTVTADNAG